MSYSPFGIARKDDRLFEQVYFETELKRRAKYLDRILNNQIPSSARDFSIAPPRLPEEEMKVTAGYGHFCSLKGGGFERWTCEDGLTCQQIDEAVGEKELGKCFPQIPRAGDACTQGQVIQSDYQTDKVKVLADRHCGTPEEKKEFECAPVKNGHPSGKYYQPDCSSRMNSKFEVCGYLAGDGFNQCITDVFAKKKTFVDCAMQFRQRAIRGLCNETKSCRNEYVFVRAKDNDGKTIQRDGYCAPSYFLFQVRHDGNPSPE